MMRCPIADQLGHDLIEAYRHAEEINLLSDHPHSEVAHIRQLMSDHRLECLICKRNLLLKEKALQMAITYIS